MITDHNYFFFQAYEILGRRLFSGTWTGYEIQETEIDKSGDDKSGDSFRK